ncbi:MAG: hypothetical protein V4710_08740 [Verrucomicrobiota bacterium]
MTSICGWHISLCGQAISFRRCAESDHRDVCLLYREEDPLCHCLSPNSSTVSVREAGDPVRTPQIIYLLFILLCTQPQSIALIQQVIEHIVYACLPKRRQRNCVRAVRQPVTSYPRLVKPDSVKGEAIIEITPLPDEFLNGIGHRPPPSDIYEFPRQRCSA